MKTQLQIDRNAELPLEHYAGICGRFMAAVEFLEARPDLIGVALDSFRAIVADHKEWSAQ